MILYSIKYTHGLVQIWGPRRVHRTCMYPVRFRHVAHNRCRFLINQTRLMLMIDIKASRSQPGLAQHVMYAGARTAAQVAAMIYRRSWPRWVTRGEAEVQDRRVIRFCNLRDKATQIMGCASSDGCLWYDCPSSHHDLGDEVGHDGRSLRLPCHEVRQPARGRTDPGLWQRRRLPMARPSSGHDPGDEVGHDGRRSHTDRGLRRGDGCLWHGPAVPGACSDRSPLSSCLPASFKETTSPSEGAESLRTS